MGMIFFGLWLGALVLLALVALYFAFIAFVWLAFSIAYLGRAFIRGVREGWQESKAAPPSAFELRMERWCAKLDSMHVRTPRHADDARPRPIRVQPVDAGVSKSGTAERVMARGR